MNNDYFFLPPPLPAAAFLEALSGLILASAVWTSTRRWVAKLQTSKVHFCFGEGVAEQTRPMVLSTMRSQPSHCSTIGWQLELEQGIRLRITALPLQLETLEAMFSPAESVRA